MTRRFLTFALFALLVAAARPALAHGDFRIIGTVTGMTEKTLDVKQTKDGKVVSMALQKTTKVTQDGKVVAASEVKVGVNVAVEAHGDTLDALEVVEIKILPPAKP